MENCPQNLFTTDLKGELIELDDRLERLLHNCQREDICFDELEKALDRVCHVASSPIYFHEYDKDWDEEGESLLLSIQEKAAKSFSLVERLSERNIYEDPQYLDCYVSDLRQTIVEQTKDLGIDSNSRVLFIGCGAQPLSCFLISDEFGCEVLGIDSDEQVIEKARRQKWMGSISLQSAKGEDFPAQGFSHIFIASLVSNKEQIIRHLYGVVDRGCKIVVRFGKGLQRLANYSFQLEQSEQWETFGCFGDSKSLYQAIGLLKR